MAMMALQMQWDLLNLLPTWYDKAKGLMQELNKAIHDLFVKWQQNIMDYIVT